MKLTWKERLASLLKIIGMIVVLLLIAVAIIFSVWRASFVSWTGFGDFTTPTGEFIRGKTIWDWMQLLVIPLSLLIAGSILNRSERDIERQRAEERAAIEQKRADDRARLEREIAMDRQHEASLQAYLDRMTDLLIKENLRTTSNEEVRNVARIRTLTVLHGLDGRRKADVLLFLNEAELINMPTPIIYLNGADLTESHLQGFDLSGTYLREVNLGKAILHFANLEHADLTGSNLDSAQLACARLKGAVLQFTFMHGASLNNTIMPDGTKHD